MANGEKATEGGVTVEAIPAYDIIPGAPAHPKGKSNGYVITLGGTRIYVAGVTECVPEVRALKNIDVAFIPLNIPLGRMTPAAAAECVKTIAPKIVYPYHYDQVLVAKLGNPNATAEGPVGGLTVAQSLQAFKDALKGEKIEVRDANWYPVAVPGSVTRKPPTGTLTTKARSNTKTHEEDRACTSGPPCCFSSCVLRGSCASCLRGQDRDV